MRDRHVPRLCRSCQAPMARQEAACWNCGTRWADEDVPETTLRVITEEQARTLPSRSSTPRPWVPDRRRYGRTIDVDRWVTDGGRVDSEAAAQVHLTTARR